MAKVKYATFVAGLAGRSGSSVFYQSPSTSFGYMRNHVQPAYTSNNETMGSIMHNIGTVFHAINTAGRADLKTYTAGYSNLGQLGDDMSARASNSMAVFVKAMWKLADTEGGAVDLKSITANDLNTLFLDMTSIKTMVKAGYLPAVPGYEDLDASMWT